VSSCFAVFPNVKPNFSFVSLFNPVIRLHCILDFFIFALVINQSSKASVIDVAAAAAAAAAAALEKSK
jgi:hypothetical protein